MGVPAAHHSEANKGARLVEREVCFIFDAGNPGWGGTPVQRPTPPTYSQWTRAFIGEGRGQQTETALSALTVHLEIGHAVA